MTYRYIPCGLFYKRSDAIAFATKCQEHSKRILTVQHYPGHGYAVIMGQASDEHVTCIATFAPTLRKGYNRGR